jgi:hypothetical protein
MNNFRVIATWTNQGETRRFRIEDVYNGKPTTSDGLYIMPFVKHSPELLSTLSVEELKITLKEMLEACDKPVLCLKEPEPFLVELNSKAMYEKIIS